jgi:hypothetical protein
MFLKLLEKLGRREVLVDATGNILFNRYYLLYHEKMDQPRWMDYLPNIYIHVFSSSFWDGEDEHNHPWNAFAIILKGGYVEHRNGKKKKTKWFSFTSHKDTHRIVDAKEGTMSMFFHGFRKQNWNHHIKKHTTICDYCAKENNGQCLKTPQVTTGFATYLNQANLPGKENLSRFRTMTWIKYDEKVEKFLERRKKAAEKLNIKSVTSREESNMALMEKINEKRKLLSQDK